MWFDQSVKVVWKSSTGHCGAHGDLSSWAPPWWHEHWSVWVTQQLLPSRMFTLINSWTGGGELILDGHTRVRTYRHIHGLGVIVQKEDHGQKSSASWIIDEMIRTAKQNYDLWLIRCWSVNDTDENRCSSPL